MTLPYEFHATCLTSGFHDMVAVLHSAYVRKPMLPPGYRHAEVGETTAVASSLLLTTGRV